MKKPNQRHLLKGTLCLIALFCACSVFSQIKYVYSIDYALGQKDRYIDWVESISADLQAPPEVLRITSHDNYFGTSPHRVIEFEFENMTAAAEYFSQRKIADIIGKAQEYGINAGIKVLHQRSDYEAHSSGGVIKYVFGIDYPLREKSAYLEWINNIAKTLSHPPELIRIRSYDDYFSSSPQRVIEYEFNDLISAAKYFGRPEIVALFNNLGNHGINASTIILERRSDYRTPVRRR